jgi:hypothetical protein
VLFSLLVFVMESQLAEASTFPAQVYAESFFANIPTDARFELSIKLDDLAILHCYFYLMILNC